MRSKHLSSLHVSARSRCAKFFEPCNFFGHNWRRSFFHICDFLTFAGANLNTYRTTDASTYAKNIVVVEHDRSVPDNGIKFT